MARSGATWQPGQSGNPAGRRLDSAVLKARRAIAKDLPAIIGKLVELALAGDTSAAKILVERAIPALRPVDPVLTAIEQRLEQLESRHE